MEKEEPLLIQVSAASLLSCLGEDQSPESGANGNGALGS